jgi:rod shape-determining protein MreB
MGYFRQNVAIDIGTATLLVYLEDKGIVVNEPSLVAVKRGSDKIVAIGDEAKNMLGRTNEETDVIKPVCGGVVSHFSLTKKMISYHLNQSIKNPLHRILKPDVMVAVPIHTTNVEKRAIERVAQEAGCARVFMIEEPLAAAIGSGLDIEQAYGHMIVDIGGGTTDVAVISFEGIVSGKSIKVAGDRFDEAIRAYIRKKYAILIGPLEAENIKKNIACLYHGMEQKSMEVHGTDIIDGVYKEITVTSDELMETMMEVAVPILDCIHEVLESTPPELAGDIYSRGILMTGNGSLIKGLDELVHRSTGIDVAVAEDPGLCVVRGAYKVLTNMNETQKSNI